jgi:hypothetical protein
LEDGISVSDTGIDSDMIVMIGHPLDSLGLPS